MATVHELFGRWARGDASVISATVELKGEAFDGLRQHDVDLAGGVLSVNTEGMLRRPRQYVDASKNDLGKVDEMVSVDDSVILYREDTLEDRVARLEREKAK